MDILDIPFRDSTHVIYDGTHWTLILHRDNQSYLGRSIVYLKSRIDDDVLTLSDAERNELWLDILPKYKQSMEAAFSADRINYSHLANTEHFIHWHLVPRYEKNPVRECEGETFVDERVGKHYAPAPEKPVSAQVMDAILEKIKEHWPR